MVRLATVVSASLIMGFVAFVVRTSATVSPQDADVNKNGAVSIADAIAVLPHIGELAPPAAAQPHEATIIDEGVLLGGAAIASGPSQCIPVSACVASGGFLLESVASFDAVFHASFDAAQFPANAQFVLVTDIAAVN